MTRVWPSRKEWAASAEHAVRTACYPLERVPEEPEHYLTAEELAELDELQTVLSAAARSALTVEIKRLRTLLPPRPPRIGERIAWFAKLPHEQATLAHQLSTLEYARTDVGRRVRGEASSLDVWRHPGRGHHVTDRVVSAFVEDVEVLDRLKELEERYRTLRREAADVALAEAIDREVAKRNSDEGWAKELERRVRIDGGPLLNTPSSAPVAPQAGLREPLAGERREAAQIPD